MPFKFYDNCINMQLLEDSVCPFALPSLFTGSATTATLRPAPDRCAALDALLPSRTTHDSLQTTDYRSLSLPFPSLPFSSLPFPSLPCPSLLFPSLLFPSLPFSSLPFSSLPFPLLYFLSLLVPGFLTKIPLATSIHLVITGSRVFSVS